MSDLVHQLRRDYCDRSVRLQAANRIEKLNKLLKHIRCELALGITEEEEMKTFIDRLLKETE